MLEVEMLFLLSWDLMVDGDTYARFYHTLVAPGEPPLWAADPASGPDVRGKQHRAQISQGDITLDVATVTAMAAQIGARDGEPDDAVENGYRICQVCRVLYWAQYAAGRCLGGADHAPSAERHQLRYASSGARVFSNGSFLQDDREIGYRCCISCGVIYWPDYPGGCRDRLSLAVCHKSAGEHHPHPYSYALTVVQRHATNSLSPVGTARACSTCGEVYVASPAVADTHTPHRFAFRIQPCEPPPPPAGAAAVANPVIALPAPPGAISIAISAKSASVPPLASIACISMAGNPAHA
jgi:hypothetical protein